MSDLTPDFTAQEVATALGMSERWVRRQVAEGASHQRYGNKLRFTPEQVEEMRASHAKAPVKKSITTGRRKS